MIVTAADLSLMWEFRVLFQPNSPPPNAGGYGWLRPERPLAVKNEIAVEPYSGLYGGAYVPSIGGTAYCGLATIGLLSYSYSPLPEPMTIGRYCSISSGLKFLDSHHPLNLVTTSIITFRDKNVLCRDFTDEEQVSRYGWEIYGNRQFPTFGHDVWIGRDCTMQMGVNIGTGSVVAANSVVTKDVPPFAIVGGNPAKIIRFRFDEDTISRLLESEWWSYHPKIICAIGFDNIPYFLEEVARLKTDQAAKLNLPVLRINDTGIFPTMP